MTHTLLTRLRQKNRKYKASLQYRLNAKLTSAALKDSFQKIMKISFNN